MTDEKRDVVMEGIEKTVKNYERGSEGKGELYIIEEGGRRFGNRSPEPGLQETRITSSNDESGYVIALALYKKPP